MPQLQFVTLDVFTRDKYAGNPLAVVLVPDGQDVPSTEQMQVVAREFNLSETVFLLQGTTAATSSSTDHVPEWRIRIFLTTGEVPFAGHPTIGTACYALSALANNAARGRFLCNAGPIDFTVASGVAKAVIPHDVRLHTQHPFSVDDVHHLQPKLSGMISPDGISVVSPVKGMSFVLCVLPSLEALARVQLSGKPKPRLDDDWNSGFAGSYFYVVTECHNEEGQLRVKLQCRMIEGAFEDPATGSAACALGAFLAMKHQASSAHFEITQGAEMGRKSEIGVGVYLQENPNVVKRIELSGTAVKIQAGTIDL